VCHRVQLEVYLRACWGVCLRASWELTSEHTVKQAGSALSRAIGGVCHREQLGTYSQAGWECAMECNREGPWEHAWECTWQRTRRCTWEHTGSVTGSTLRAYLRSLVNHAGSVPTRAIGSVHSSKLGVCNRVQSGVYFSAFPGVCNEVHLAACIQVCCMQREYSMQCDV